MTKYCSACQHCQRDGDFKDDRSALLYARCAAGTHSALALVDKCFNATTYCTVMREPHAACGPDGRLYVAKVTPENFTAGGTP